MMQQQQRLKQQQVMSMMQYHPAFLATPQIEPILSGNLPPGFDSSTCRSVYVGNIHPSVTEPLLQQVFSSTGPIEGCKLIRKEKSSYGFVDYFDRRSAAHAILTLNGRPVFGQPIKVNWAYASSQREDTSGHHNVFVGDLSPEVTDATLYAYFSSYPTCSDARVMWDQKTGRSRGFGFVSFRNQQDAQSAINDLNDDGQDKKSDDAPENNPQYTTVYVTSVDLHRHFHLLGAGTIEDVRVQRDKGFGFVRYSTHAEAAFAIQMGNARILCGKPIKCSWGSKPTPPGTSSAPLPPPAAAQIPGFSAADLMNYERQMALSKMGSMQAALMQHHAAAMGMGAAVGSSQAIYDGGFPSVATTQQQLMYYH
ncbi:unnamed protein product [Linum tenue]|uniref:RRM domain-containing protein n=1 Tax=Linum tenue TaxID=586396 RepID=A0AAV0IWU8_9ROSI|nr:unnamed protein product [Linum tenue]